MANIKATFIFNAQKQGWSETYYIVRSSLANAVQAAVDFCDARARLLAQGSSIEAFRLSDDEVVGDSFYSPISPGYTEERATASPRDTVQTAILGRWSSGTLYRRQAWLAGVPDAWTVFNPLAGAFELNGVAYGGFMYLRSVLISSPFAIKAISKIDADINKRSVDFATVDQGNILITSVTHGFQQNDTVRINMSKGPGSEYLNGKFKVFAPLVNSFVIHAEVPAGTDFIYTGGGIIRRQVMKYFNIDDGTYLRIANRQRGRAYFVPRGRSPVRR